MVCYFGCQTGANKCAYFWWALLISAAAGCILGWYFVSNACINEAEQCLDAQGIQAGNYFQNFSPQTILDSFTEGVNATTLCESLLPDNVPACEICYEQVEPCFVPTIGMLIAGVVLGAASFCACLFCCCCSSAPRDKYYA